MRLRSVFLMIGILVRRILQDLIPGGSLGKIVHIKDIMINLESTPKINLEATIKDAIEEITNKKLGFTAIVDKQNVPKGIFTDGDLRRSLLSHISR